MYGHRGAINIGSSTFRHSVAGHWETFPRESVIEEIQIYVKLAPVLRGSGGKGEIPSHDYLRACGGRSGVGTGSLRHVLKHVLSALGYVV